MSTDTQQKSNEVSDEEIEKIVADEVPILTEEEYYKRDVDESYFKYNSGRTSIRAIVRSGIRKALQRHPTTTEPIKDEELWEKFRYEIAGNCINDLAANNAATYCVEIAKQYAASKTKDLQKDLDILRS